jgi:hypothetical protein
MPTLRKTELPPDVMIRRVISLRQASEIAGVSIDTLKRRHGDKIIKLSVRRSGMRLRDVLAIGELA